MRSVKTVATANRAGAATGNDVTIRRHIGGRGVVVVGLRYNSRDLQALRARMRQREHVQIKFDRADQKTILVRDENIWLQVLCVNRPSYKTECAGSLIQQRHLSPRAASRLRAFERDIGRELFSARVHYRASTAPHHPHRPGHTASLLRSRAHGKRQPPGFPDCAAGLGYDAAKREVDLALQELARAKRSAGRALASISPTPTRHESTTGRPLPRPTKGN
jgi:hypothetical protein